MLKMSRSLLSTDAVFIPLDGRIVPIRSGMISRDLLRKILFARLSVWRPKVREKKRTRKERKRVKEYDPAEVQRCTSYTRPLLSNTPNR
jgi:hypothetical protein